VPWHFHKTTYSNIKVESRTTANLGIVGPAVRNPYNSTITSQVRVDRSVSKSISVNASVEVEASGRVASVRASTGLEVTNGAP